ncbi:MAG: chemotaxis protein CheW [Opitutaceae bacterium]|nr:chemotaxis protein CheW [Opitutaceae bacterium]
MREIIKMMDITGVPQVPAHVKGVINLRGKVIPIVDLRRRSSNLAAARPPSAPVSWFVRVLASNLTSRWA